MENGSANVLIVDDNIQNVELLEAILLSRGYHVHKAYNGEDALKMVDKMLPHIILLDVMMPGIDGYEVCKRIKQGEKTRFIPVIMLTALNGLEDKIKGIEAGADDFLAKPFQKPELIARVKSLIRLRNLIVELDSAQNVIYSLALAIDFNDPYTHGHSQRVSDMSARLAGFMGLSQNEQQIIRHAGVLHDIGKRATDKKVLHKTGSLDKVEYNHVKEHPVIGEKICSPLNFAKPVLPIIRWHHEHFNGSGYPDGLSGADIPLGARILSVVDVYDALTSARPYRQGLLTDKALEIINTEASKGYWDADVVKPFLDMLKTDGAFSNV